MILIKKTSNKIKYEEWKHGSQSHTHTHTVGRYMIAF